MLNIVALILGAVGVFVTILNWTALFASRRRNRHISMAAPFPSVLTALGLALYEHTRAYWWVGLLTDYTLFAFVAVLPRLIAEQWQTSRFTRIRLLQAEEPARRLTLSLHRGGHFHLSATFEPPMPCGHGACISSLGATGHWEVLPGGDLRLWGYRDERVLTLHPVNQQYIGREEHYPEGCEFPYDALDGATFQSRG